MKNSLIPVHVISFAFYRRYFALFAIFFYCAFGILSGSDHMMLAGIILGSELYLFSLLLLWIIYAVITTIFSRNIIRAKANHFIWVLSFMKPLKQLYYLFLVQVILMLPISFYAIFLISQSHTVLSSIILLSFIILVNLIPTFYLFFYLKKPTSITYSRGILLPLKFQKPFVLWPYYYLINEKLLSIITLKVISAGIIYLTAIWNDSAYDLRWWALGIIFSSVPGIMLLKDASAFLLSNKNLLNQLAWTKLRWCSKISLIGLLMFMPEAFLLIRHFSYEKGISALILLLIFGYLLIFSFFTYFLRYNPTLEMFLSRIFFFTIVAFLLNLFLFPLWIFVVILIVLSSYWLFSSNFFLED